MEQITKKMAFVRKAYRKGVLMGVLSSPSECGSMDSTLWRWNHNEGKPNDVFIESNVDRSSGIVVLRVKKLRKEVKV